MADQLLFEQSNESQMTTEPFVSRQVVYVIDQNNGSYSGQIQLDTSSLSNSGKYASYSEAYLEIPFVIAATTNINATAAAGASLAQSLNFLVGIKNGFYQLIHSLSVEYNNNSVIQLTPFTNFYINYKLMTSLSEGDVKKFGQSIGFYPDNAMSFTYTTAASVAAGGVSSQGPGSSNNRPFGWEMIYPAGNGSILSVNAIGIGNNLAVMAGAIAAGAVYPNLVTVNTPSYITQGGPNSIGNYGFFKRMQFASYQPSIAPYSNLLAIGSTTALLKNYYQYSIANPSVLSWNILARIRLKDVSDFFDKMPLVKGAYLRFIINYNASSQTLAIANAVAPGVLPTIALGSTPTLTNGTNPIMISSFELGQGGNPYGLNQPQAGNWTISCGVVSTQGITHGMSSCRLYVPLYQMNPIQEQAYLSLNPTKTIVYRDIYQYTVSVSAGASFNNLLTNGIPNPKTIIIIPILASTSNNAGLAAQAISISPYQSPFSSEPGTTSPLVALTNFNIQIAGVNMFLSNEVYDFEQFVNELSSQNCINGGLVDGLTSGLIGELDYSMMYRYYVCDVSRRLPAEDKVPKSVQILGQNLSACDINLFVFIEFEKQIQISLMTGEKLA